MPLLPQPPRPGAPAFEAARAVAVREGFAKKSPIATQSDAEIPGEDVWERERQRRLERDRERLDSDAAGQ
jgi:hypothetical protein